MTDIDLWYQHNISQWSDIWEHLPTLRSLVIETEGQVVVELGTRSAVSTSAFLSGVQETGGHVWSVDITPIEVPEDLQEKWTFITGDDMDHAVHAVVPNDIDVLFIDTSHCYEHTKAELDVWAPRASVIALHDTELEHPEGTGCPESDPPFPVKTAVEEYLAKYPGFSAEWYENCYGLAVLRRV